MGVADKLRGGCGDRCSGGSVVHGALEYHCAETPVVKAIHPVFGPFAGGTTITIDGSGFSASTVCRFGPLQVLAAQVIGAHRILCVLPEGSALSCKLLEPPVAAMSELSVRS